MWFKWFTIVLHTNLGLDTDIIMDNIWNNIKNSLKEDVPGHVFKMWLESLNFLEYNNKELILSCNNSFIKKNIKQRFEFFILQAGEKFAVFPITLSLKLIKPDNKNWKKKPSLNQKQLPDIYLRLYGRRPFRKSFTFDNFVVGNNNDFAYSASLALASKENNSQNSLFLLS